MIPFFILLFLILLAVYGWLIDKYSKAWKKIPDFITGDEQPITTISVIIAARNEEDNIDTLLKSLEAQDYSKDKFEVIIIDDHSTDRTYELLSSYQGPMNLKVLQSATTNSVAFKKKALQTGIDQASGTLIVTSDADCLFNSCWLRTIAVFYEKNGYRCIAAPVKFISRFSVLSIFQSLDFLTLQGITGASISSGLHIMSNGANFIYERNVFYEVNGFEEIENTPSGDDMLLMQKITELYPDSAGFLKSRQAIVHTYPMSTWRSFFNQRIRWSSKSGNYRDKNTFRILLLVYLVNLFFLILIIISIYDPFLFFLLVLFLIAKLLIEFPFVSAVASFFGSGSLMKWFPLMQPLHIGYTIIAGFLGKFGSYTWKERRISRSKE